MALANEGSPVILELAQWLPHYFNIRDSKKGNHRRRTFNVSENILAKEILSINRVWTYFCVFYISKQKIAQECCTRKICDFSSLKKWFLSLQKCEKSILLKEILVESGFAALSLSNFGV